MNDSGGEGSGAEGFSVQDSRREDRYVNDSRGEGAITGGRDGAWACPACLRRSWLVARLGPQLEFARRRGRDLPAVLHLADDALIAAVAGGARAEVERGYEAFDPGEAIARCRAAAVEQICCCQRAYPTVLAVTAGAPAVLHVAGGRERFAALSADDAVAIVGARRGSAYGLEVARSLGRSLAAAGVTVVSGMAFGVDSAAHTGALEAGGPTIAVLPAGAERAYPAAKRALYRRIVESGVAVSELPPGSETRRWVFPARNRVIAGLARMTVVVEAGVRSGSLITAAIAQDLGRTVGAVPGRVTSPLSAGANELLTRGAVLVRDAGDVLDAVFGVGVRTAPARRVRLRGELGELLDAIDAGWDTLGALVARGREVEATLSGLAELEMTGHVRREAGGRYVALMPG